MKNVLLLRSGDNLGAYASSMPPGWAVNQISPIRKHFINLPRLADTIKSTDFDGMILTSKTAVEAVSQTQVDFTGPVFVVGQATGAAVRQNLNSITEIIGEKSGDAVRLAPMIIDYFNGQSEPVNLLHPGATKMIGGLAEKIAPIKSLHLPVYETCPRDRAELEAELDKMSSTEFDAIVYFSPSGVNAARDVIRTRWPRARQIAIGQSTASVLDSCLVCKDPNPAGKLN